MFRQEVFFIGATTTLLVGSPFEKDSGVEIVGDETG
jgi:hypothetical protein